MKTTLFKMKATLLPEKQLRHILEKQGFVCSKTSGNYRKNGCRFLKEAFALCLKELEITPIKRFPGSSLEKYPEFHFRIKKNTQRFLHKNWFIPNSFKEVK